MLNKLLVALSSGIAGTVVVVAAVKIPWMSWAVDGPGWLVNLFTSIDFHEGDGVLGFILAIFLSWLCWSLAIWLVIRIYRRLGLQSQQVG